MKNLDWTPLLEGGSNYRTKKLKIVSDKKIILKSITRIIDFFILLIFGGIPYIIVKSFLVNGDLPSVVYLALFFVSLVSFLFCCGFIYFHFQPTIFDLERNIFYKGYSPGNKIINLNEIKGIQIINEHVIETSQSSSSSLRTNRFYSYEINLVLNDGKRVNVMDHGDKKAIVKDTKTLAKFLNVPVYAQQ